MAAWSRKRSIGREIECAVLGNLEPRASLPGEIEPGADFYDYDDKYNDGRPSCSSRHRYRQRVTEELQALACEAFGALRCEGMARVDFFYEEGGRGLLVNEVNTIPGFTPISMYPQMWQAIGLGYRELIDELIRLAIERYDRRAAKRRRLSRPSLNLTTGRITPRPARRPRLPRMPPLARRPVVVLRHARRPRGRRADRGRQGRDQWSRSPASLPVSGWLPDGRLLRGVDDRSRLLRLDDGELVEVADLTELRPFHCNDMVVDQNGRAYIGNFGFDLDAGERADGHHARVRRARRRGMGGRRADAVPQRHR